MTSTSVPHAHVRSKILPRRAAKGRVSFTVQTSGPDAVKVEAQYRTGVDPDLVSIVETASGYTSYDVELRSGVRAGDTREHRSGNAIDITLIDRSSGRKLPSYQNGADFRPYEEFAQAARAVQMHYFPELEKKFRWGGYFGTADLPTKYGAFDLMHFDLGGDRNGMAGGSWTTGLHRHMRTFYNVQNSQGMGANSNSRTHLATLAQVNGTRPWILTPDVDTFVDFHASFGTAEVTFEGSLRGDGFPNAELFVLDVRGNAVGLVDYRTKSGGGGIATRLFGSHSNNQLAQFRASAALDSMGAFARAVMPLVVTER